MEILAREIINKLCDEHLLNVITMSNELKIFLDILNILD
jgi:hypothetical protein